MTPRNILAKKPALLPLMGMAFGTLFWLIDAAVDFTFFGEEGHSFMTILVAPEPMDIWMRGLVMVMLLIFSFIARKLLLDEIHAKQELEKYKNNLEKTVAERTRELQYKNEDLNKEILTRQKAETELQKLAVTDPLTGICNRRMFHQMLDTEIERDLRYHGGLGVILCDLDHFKLVNDNFGHGVGDQILQLFAENTRKYLRDSDILARWGGEEFIILIPQTDLEKTRAISEKIRTATEKLSSPPVLSFTGSFGVTIFHNKDTVESFIKRADDAMYLAKRHGRNRVEALTRAEMG